jgi:hypothetical protein
MNPRHSSSTRVLMGFFPVPRNFIIQVRDFWLVTDPSS